MTISRGALTIVCATSIVCSTIAGTSETLTAGLDAEHVEAMADCARFVAKGHFKPGRRLVIACGACDELAGAIARSLMVNQAIAIGRRTVRQGYRGTPGYIVVDRSKTLAGLRDLSQSNFNSSAIVQYLVVTTTDLEEVLRFHRDTRHVRFWNSAFLVLDEKAGGVVARPVYTGDLVELSTFGFCTRHNRSLTTETTREFLARVCFGEQCKLRYASIGGNTTTYWYQEDSFKLNRKQDMDGIAYMFISMFSELYNLTIDTSLGFALTWRDADELLANNMVDIVSGTVANDMSLTRNFKIVCRYVSREMAFAAKVKRRTLPNELVKLLMPFDYAVWMWATVIALSHVGLVLALRRLARTGLIGERLQLMQVCRVMFLQGSALPRKFSLRYVIGVFMLFSLYLSIIYNSTFTSSLTRLDVDEVVHDLEELGYSDQPIGGPTITMSYLNDTRDPVMLELAKRYQTITVDKVVRKMLNENLMGVLQLSTVDKINWINRADRFRRIYTLSKPVLRYPLLFLTRRGHPYSYPLQRIVLRCRETGLLGKWVNNFVIDKRKRAVQDADDAMLKMTHLRGVFKLFLMCHAFNVLVFLIETLPRRVPMIFRQR